MYRVRQEIEICDTRISEPDFRDYFFNTLDEAMQFIEKNCDFYEDEDVVWRNGPDGYIGYYEEGGDAFVIYKE